MNLRTIIRNLDSKGVKVELIQTPYVGKGYPRKSYLILETDYNFEIEVEGTESATLIYVPNTRKRFTDSDSLLDFIINLKTQTYK